MADRRGKCAEVAVSLPINRLFHYGVPENLKSEIGVGKRIWVEFGSDRPKEILYEARVPLSIWPRRRPAPTPGAAPALGSVSTSLAEEGYIMTGKTFMNAVPMRKGIFSKCYSTQNNRNSFRKRYGKYFSGFKCTD